MIKIIVLGGIVFWSTGVCAENEITNIKHYDACHVATGIDLLTDETKPTLICLDETRQIKISIIDFPDKGLVLGLEAGWLFYLRNKIDISIRFYPAPVIDQEAHITPGSNMAVIANPEFYPTFIESLLPQLAAGTKLIIKVGKNSGVINLKGSARAVRDFQQRRLAKKKLNKNINVPQTLELPIKPIPKKEIDIVPFLDRDNPPEHIQAWIIKLQNSCVEPKQTWWNTKVSKTYPELHKKYLMCLEQAKEGTLDSWIACQRHPSCKGDKWRDN